MRPIIILWSALRHYSRVKQRFGKPAYYDPHTDTFYPSDLSLDEDEQVVLVDHNVVSGRTLAVTRHQLEKRFGVTEVRYAGNPKTEYARRILDYTLPDTGVTGILVSVSGRAATGKSSFAYGLYAALRRRGVDSTFVKWGKWLTERFEVGNYGEKLAEEERRNPFVATERFVEEMHGLMRKNVVVMDGLKSYEQAKFISQALWKPLVPVYTDSSDELRKIILATRRMHDDVPERDELFRGSLAGLREYSFHVELDSRRVPRDLEHVVGLLGLEPPTIRGVFNPFFTKTILLEGYYRATVKPEPRRLLHLIRDEVEPYMHRGYISRLRRAARKKVPPEAEELVSAVATSYRLVDDILDENTVRYFSEEGVTRPAYWMRHSILETVTHAVTLFVHARWLARKLGVEESLLAAHRRVVDAVKLELRFEEVGGNPNITDWLRAAGREAWFRWFLASMLGENPVKWYAHGLAAQIKDDLLGARKGGREDTEARLNRPLIQRVLSVDEAQRLAKALKTGAFASIRDVNNLVLRVARSAARAAACG